MVHNLKNYKLAGLFAKDLEEILKRVDKALEALLPFQRYKPVARIILELKNNRAVLLSHLDKANQIKKTKGQVSGA